MKGSARVGKKGKFKAKSDVPQERKEKMKRKVKIMRKRR